MLRNVSRIRRWRSPLEEFHRAAPPAPDQPQRPASRGQQVVQDGRHSGAFLFGCRPAGQTAEEGFFSSLIMSWLSLKKIPWHECEPAVSVKFSFSFHKLELLNYLGFENVKCGFKLLLLFFFSLSQSLLIGFLFIWDLRLLTFERLDWTFICC